MFGDAYEEHFFAFKVSAAALHESNTALTVTRYEINRRYDKAVKRFLTVGSVLYLVVSVVRHVNKNIPVIMMEIALFMMIMMINKIHLYYLFHK